jgi:hypothetical protein
MAEDPVAEEPVAEEPVAEDLLRRLGAEPGLCGACRHRKLNETGRGTVYLRCRRASWDRRLVRYPRLPVGTCPGFERS